MNKLPKARTADLVTQELDREVLLYDLKTHKAYSLNETSTIIFNACDGNTSFAVLKNKHGFTDDLIFLSLEQLKKENLIDETEEAFVSPFAGMSRRQVIQRVGLGSMIALPIISSLIAPTAAQAQSGGCVIDGPTSCNCPYTGSSTTTCTGDGTNCPSAACICNANCFQIEAPNGPFICAGNCSEP